MLTLLLMLAAAPDLFARPNLVAWCVVPFDANKRSPEERAAMLARNGFTKYAYDWRAEHLPTFGRELVALKAHKIELAGVWCPAALDADAKTLLAGLAKHEVRTTLWVMFAEPKGTQAEKVSAAAESLRPLAEAAAKQGCKVGLYNHGGWPGEPENQIAVIAKLGAANVGLVYNLHHGHAHMARFPKLLAAMKPHLYCLNLNGMTPDGDRKGEKILVVGHGTDDANLLKEIRASGYAGPIGILGHTGDDAEARLRDNLDGLDWLTAKERGKDAGPRPKPRTKPGQ